MCVHHLDPPGFSEKEKLTRIWGGVEQRVILRMRSRERSLKGRISISIRGWTSKFFRVLGFS